VTSPPTPTTGAPAGQPGRSRSRAAVDEPLLADLLTVEHAACYLYGLAGGIAANGAPSALGTTGENGPPHLPTGPGAAAVVLALDGLNTHSARRDTLADRIRALGGTPPASAVAYQPPIKVTDPISALLMLARVEDSVTSVNENVLIAAAAPTTRDFAAGTLADAAVRAMRSRRAAGQPPAQASRATPGR
jgi:Domain of unknown function (DUF4439)